MAGESPPPVKRRRGRPPGAEAGSEAKVWLYQLLLALQYGAQPLISKRYIGPNVIVTSSVISCEVAKVVFALLLLAKDGNLGKLFKQWSLVDGLTASALPAAIYALQNSLLQISYKNLDSLTFSILNQTKLLFTALFTYVILGHRQSTKQIGALGLLLVASVLLSAGESSGKTLANVNPDHVMIYGITPVMVASVLSGMASSLCQWASQVKKHTSYLMTVEMSFVGTCVLLISTLKSPDGEAIRNNGFFHGWTALTLIPIFLNAIGGILVGLVTTYAGGVKKGFVIVSALLVTALLQYIFEGKQLSLYCLASLPLAICSTAIYHRYPYKAKEKKV